MLNTKLDFIKIRIIIMYYVLINFACSYVPYLPIQCAVVPLYFYGEIVLKMYGKILLKGKKCVKKLRILDGSLVWFRFCVFFFFVNVSEKKIKKFRPRRSLNFPRFPTKLANCFTPFEREPTGRHCCPLGFRR